jgi:N-glycosylase/DNA lyase
MFVKKHKVINGEAVISISELQYFSLADTLECGQAFRYELLKKEEGYVEYLTVVKDNLIRVGQRSDGELLFYEISDDVFEQVCLPYFSLDTDYAAIKREVSALANSPRLSEAADLADGIRILRQDPWEALFSFIISQNNNIPRIRKIIRKISAEYGKNLSETREKCPKDSSIKPCREVCSECGICYSFPTARAVLDNPDGLLPSKPGFRYKYLLDAAEKVSTGEVSLEKIAECGNAEFTLEELKRIKGVGDKVASCVALFGFGNLDAFPVDVWIRRAIDEYFDGKLDPASLGKYAGVAQQYIFHYIRNLEQKAEK